MPLSRSSCKRLNSETHWYSARERKAKEMSAEPLSVTTHLAARNRSRIAHYCTPAIRRPPFKSRSRRVRNQTNTCKESSGRNNFHEPVRLTPVRTHDELVGARGGQGHDDLFGGQAGERRHSTHFSCNTERGTSVIALSSTHRVSSVPTCFGIATSSDGGFRPSVTRVGRKKSGNGKHTNGAGAILSSLIPSYSTRR